MLQGFIPIWPSVPSQISFFFATVSEHFFIKRKRNKVQRQQTGWFQRAETQPRKRYKKWKITQSAIRDPTIYQATTRAVLVAYNLPRTRQSTRPAAGRVTEVPSWRHDLKTFPHRLPPTNELTIIDIRGECAPTHPVKEIEPQIPGKRAFDQ